MTLCIYDTLHKIIFNQLVKLYQFVKHAKEQEVKNLKKKMKNKVVSFDASFSRKSSLKNLSNTRALTMNIGANGFRVACWQSTDDFYFKLDFLGNEGFQNFIVHFWYIFLWNNLLHDLYSIWWSLSLYSKDLRTIFPCFTFPSYFIISSQMKYNEKQ